MRPSRPFVRFALVPAALALAVAIAGFIAPVAAHARPAGSSAAPRATGAVPDLRAPRATGASGVTRATGATAAAAPRIVATGIRPAGGTGASYPQQRDSYPRNGQDHVPIDAELYVVFDQPTLKSDAIFEVADLDSTGLLSLNAPRYSALGDTLFIKPQYPMRYGRPHGMRIDKIVAVDSTIRFDLPIVYFTTFARANVQRVGNATYESISLVPDHPSPVSIGVQETAGTAVSFTGARYRFYPADQIDLHAPFSIVPTSYTDVPFAATIGRRGAALLNLPVMLSRQDAAAAGDGLLGLDLIFDGTDETGLPLTFGATLRIRTNTFPGDSTQIATRVQVTPAIGASIGIGSVYLESPLPGTTYAPEDSLRPRAVVTGIGTGPYRGVFYMDGDPAALVEGFLESGRPDTVTTPGPLPTRRLGEHRLQFVVESPQNVASAPITILSVTRRPPPGADGAGGTAAGDTGAGSGADASTAKRTSLTLEGGELIQARTPYGDTDGSAVYWGRTKGVTTFGGGGKPGEGTRLEADALWRLRLDDAKNGSGSPERVSLRVTAKRGTVEWGDVSPGIASGAPLLASSVPRRAAQATVNAGGLGTLEGYVAMDAHPRSAGGPGREARSDLYAARLSRALGARLRVSAYGGYTHEEPTPGGVETATRARAIYGGAGTMTLPSGWTWLADVATVRHRAIEGVETGRSRTAVRSQVGGTLVGADLRAEGFRYQPDLATELNPYAISDRQGMAFSVKRSIKNLWRIFGDYRFEEPSERIGPVATPFGPLGGVPYVSVERIALGTGLALNQSSSVTPVLIRVRHRGDQTELTETRLSSELSVAEALGGRTSAKFDVAIFDDDKGVGKKRKLIAGTFVSMRRHPGNITTTTIIGVENDKHTDLDLTDRTVQGTFELRWDAKSGRFAVVPYATYADRRLESQGRREELISGRLQVMAMRLKPLFGSTVAIEGRVGHVTHKEPSTDKSTDYGASLTIIPSGL